ncbi:phosphatidylethanolamine-binding protein [Mycena rosella]|uniref:Phosphatidylethanolamine-binding protein n=1 Tax=Mycena rosella TaxID=1033263 RepID=A0AAD7DKU3_MYCRO|nr:phosphatidylethanolamine-binding protein [Mycena rosella]
MMISLTVVSLALLSVANAATTLDISAIEAHFQQALIVPSLLPAFTPTAVLSVAFSGSAITPGQALAQADVATKPVVTVSAVDGTTPLTGSFTIAMVDADVVGTDESGGVSRHWLENAVTLESDTVSNASAKTITAYAGPGPASGSGPHRYVVLLYQQPSTFTAPANLSTLVDGVQKFDLTAYVKDSGLGDLVAANYFTVEVGTDSTSLPVTSSVVTSTLASAGASGSGVKSTGTGSTSAPGPSGSNPPNGGAASFKLDFASSVLVAVTMMVLLQ